jgi:hypothetical protein
MIDYEMIDRVTKQYVDKNIQQLKEYCQDESIAKFVEYITYPINHPELKYNQDVKYSVALNLYKFAYDLIDYDFDSAITNEFHFQADWIYQLNSFIGNFFNDDLYFVLYKENKTSFWKVRTSNDYDRGSQDPRELIQAAKDNVAISQKIQERIESMHRK